MNKPPGLLRHQHERSAQVHLLLIEILPLLLFACFWLFVSLGFGKSAGGTRDSGFRFASLKWAAYRPGASLYTVLYMLYIQERSLLNATTASRQKHRQVQRKGAATGAARSYAGSVAAAQMPLRMRK